MPKAVITLADKDGQIEMSLFLEGGFQKESHAHQHANLVLTYLDSIAGMKTEQAVQWVDGAFTPSNDTPDTKPVQNEGLRQHLESIKDELTAALPYRGRDTKLWVALDRLTAEIEKALSIPDEAPAPVDMAHRIVGADGLALGL